MIVGQSYSRLFVCSSGSGAAVDADSLPVATASRNSVDDAGFVLTVAKIDTGRYRITGQVPAYSVGDLVDVSVAATIQGVAMKAIVDAFEVIAAPATAAQVADAKASADAATLAAASAESAVDDLADDVARIDSHTSGATVEVLSFVAAGGIVNIYSGMDHVGTRALSFPVTDWDGPDITAGEMKLRLISRRKWQENNRVADFELSATVALVNGDGSISAELSNAESGALTIGQQAYRYQLVHTNSGTVTVVLEGWAHVNNVVAPEAEA
jgi:hypothetical protein